MAVLAGVFAFQVYRAIHLPIGVGEAYLYDRFVRPTTRQVLASELFDRDVLYSLLEKRSVGLFHVSPFAVRLPSLLFGILYLWLVWQLAERYPWMLALSTLPLVWDCFARAEGTGAALAIFVLAARIAMRRKYLNLIGICLGLSVTANVTFAIPAAVLALAILALQRHWDDWCNQVLIPGIAVALIVLVLPLSHAHASSPTAIELTDVQASNLQSALDALLAVGNGHMRIAAAPGAEPVVNFYRAQHRATNWERAVPDEGSEHFDYYLLPAADATSVRQRHLIVLHRDADFLLAHREIAPM